MELIWIILMESNTSQGAAVVLKLSWKPTVTSDEDTDEEHVSHVDQETPISIRPPD